MSYPVVKVKSKAESERDGVKAIFRELRGHDYKAISQDHAAWTGLKASGTISEIEARWRVGLSLPVGQWSHVDTIWDLGRKWNELGALMPKVAKPGDDSYVCEDCGATVDASTAGRIVFNKHHVCAKCFTVALAADAVAVNETQRGGER